MSQGEARASRDSALGFDLDRVILPVRDGVTPSERPPVRIFLGTEGAQYRADRVLVWSIEKVRDPSRVYEITLLKDLPGFDRRGWTTSFTNYRFAIPSLMGGMGRAIYNDEDQLYLADPAELFDLDMGDHGYLSVSAKDTSVMLLDAAKMSSVWSIEASRKRTKRSLLRRASDVSGLYGSLDGAWNVRDDSFEESSARCLHYTTLHTQPWRPFPDRFVYDHHPDESLWFELEREANVAGFRLFGFDAPSLGFAAGLDRVEGQVSGAKGTAVSDSEEALQRLMAEFGVKDILEVGMSERRGSPTVPEPRSSAPRHRYLTWLEWQQEFGLEKDAGGVVCLDALSSLPRADVPWIVDGLFDRARDFVFARVRCEVPEPVAGHKGPPAGTDGGLQWWKFVFESASARRPGVHWELALENDPRFPEASTATLRGGAARGTGSPRVWVLEDGDAGHRESCRTLAEALGWPFVIKQVADPIEGDLGVPWPDLVIGAGPILAKASTKIRASSHGRTLSVQLGDAGRYTVADFDLSVISSSTRHFPHAQRMELAGPLVSVEAGERKSEDPAAKRRFMFLAGGGSRHRTWDVDFAVRMGTDVERLVREGGGCLAAATVSALDPRVEAGLKRALGDADQFAPGELAGDAQKTWLDSGDVFIVSGDDDRLLARACATGRPVLIYPVPRRAATITQALADRLRDWVLKSSLARPLNRRGTTRPQKRNELRCARWIERGTVTLVPDPRRFHDRLVEEGHARYFSEGVGPSSGPLREVEAVARRVREMLGGSPGILVAGSRN